MNGSAGCGKARGLRLVLSLVGVGVSFDIVIAELLLQYGSDTTDSFPASASPELAFEVLATFAAGRSSGWRSPSLAARGRLRDGS